MCESVKVCLWVYLLMCNASVCRLCVRGCAGVCVRERVVCVCE